MLGARDFGARGVAGPEVLGPDARRAGRGWPQCQRPLLACGGCGGWCLHEQADAVRALAGSGQGPAVLVGHSHGRTIVTAAAAASPGLVAGVIYLDAAVPRSGESTSGTWPDSLRAELAGTVRGGQLPAPAESAELVVPTPAGLGHSAGRR